MPVKELCRKHGFSDASFYTWRAKFGGMEVSEARRLKGLEVENARLTRDRTWPRRGTGQRRFPPVGTVP
nr:transposase [Burkholderia mallei]